MLQTDITRESTNLYKGVGILLIVLHNYFHNIPPIIGQNEFVFHLAVTDRFVDAILDSPTNWLRAIFSYLGHYGVQLFIFLSAFGLTKGYLDKTVRYTTFLKKRFSKIYLSFAICVAVYVALGILKTIYLTDEKVLYWDSLAWKLLLVSNLVPGQAMKPVGPWWFIPFILQFYLLFPFLLQTYRRFGVFSLFAISIASLTVEFLLNPYLIGYGININYNAIGHLPVFCLGIYFASRPQLHIPSSILFTSAAIFLLGCLYPAAWLLADLCMTIIMLSVFRWFFRKLSETGVAIYIIGFYGAISFHLFMVNGFLRSPFHDIAVQYNLWWLTILCGFANLLFSSIFAIVLRYMDNMLRYYLPIVRRSWQT